MTLTSTHLSEPTQVVWTNRSKVAKHIIKYNPVTKQVAFSLDSLVKDGTLQDAKNILLGYKNESGNQVTLSGYEEGTVMLANPSQALHMGEQGLLVDFKGQPSARFSFYLVYGNEEPLYIQPLNELVLESKLPHLKLTVDKEQIVGKNQLLTLTLEDLAGNSLQAADLKDLVEINYESPVYASLLLRDSKKYLYKPSSLARLIQEGALIMDDQAPQRANLPLLIYLTPATGAKEATFTIQLLHEGKILKTVDVKWRDS